MATRTDCLPWWRTPILLLDRQGGKISSNCKTVNGNVQCAPELLRQQAEKVLQSTNFWPQGKKLTLETYTLARYMTSEVGNGTPEDRAAVGEAAVNRARIWKKSSVNDILLYRQSRSHPNYGFYGPIHDTDKGCAARGEPELCAPFGRWAATSKDPTLANLVLADLILTGQTRNFANGADDQVGMEYFKNPVAKLNSAAKRGSYWVGPLPGVDHWHTFLFRDFGISPDNPLGQALLARGLSAVASRARPNWSGLKICSRSVVDPSRPAFIVGSVGLAGLLLGLGLGRTATLDRLGL
jgi:hypothetical protein